MNRSHNKLDRQKLAKILAMTTSPCDAEALVAARKAAKILADAELTYSNVLSVDGASPSGSLPRRDADAEMAWRKVAELRREIEALRRERAVKAEPARNASVQIARLKDRLLAEMPLREWERQTLLQFSQIRPKSREEYYILWLMRRYPLAV